MHPLAHGMGSGPAVTRGELAMTEEEQEEQKREREHEHAKRG